MKTLLIDGGLVRLAASSMLSGAEPCLMPSPSQEVTRRFAKIILGLVSQHQPGALIIAKDKGPYLRAAEYKAWYRGKVFASVVGEDIYMKYDNAVYKVIVQDGIRSLSKALAKAPRLEVEEKANWETDMDETLMALAPSYKGKRKEADYKPLGFDTRAEFYAAVDLAVDRTLGYMASLLPCYKAEIPGWEADDIAGVYCATATPRVDHIVLATVDSDWQQIVCPLHPPKGYSHRVIVHDLYHDVQVGYLDREQVQKATIQKLIGGDTSDNILGLPKGDNGRYGKQVDINKIDDVQALLATHEGQRNKALVLLPTPWLVRDLAQAKITLQDGLVKMEANADPKHCYLAESDVAEIKDRNVAKGIVNKLLARLPKQGEEE